MNVNNPKISVIVPIYGVEKYIGKFAHSLMEQTMTDGVEFIFVNDATKDDSIGVLKSVLASYPEMEDQVKIVSHDENKGLPSARNTGLSVACGEYVIHFDSDDYLEPTILEALYRKAEADNLDMVWCDWNLVTYNSCISIQEPCYNNAREALKGMLIGPMHYNVWNKLIRRSLFTGNSISFPDGYSMGEDMTIMMVTACADKVGKAEGNLYNYVKYDNRTITANYTDYHITSLKHNVERVCDFVNASFHDKYDKELACMKLGVKSVFLVSGIKPKLFRVWKTLFPEANKYIGQNPRALGRIVMLERCAVRNLFFIVGLYNFFIVDIYNKLRYR